MLVSCFPSKSPLRIPSVSPKPSKHWTQNRKPWYPWSLKQKKITKKSRDEMKIGTIYWGSIPAVKPKLVAHDYTPVVSMLSEMFTVTTPWRAVIYTFPFIHWDQWYLNSNDTFHSLTTRLYFYCVTAKLSLFPRSIWTGNTRIYYIWLGIDWWLIFEIGLGLIVSSPCAIPLFCILILYRHKVNLLRLASPEMRLKQLTWFNQCLTRYWWA